MKRLCKETRDRFVIAIFPQFFLDLTAQTFQIATNPFWKTTYLMKPKNIKNWFYVYSLLNNHYLTFRFAFNRRNETVFLTFFLL